MIGLFLILSTLSIPVNDVFFHVRKRRMFQDTIRMCSDLVKVVVVQLLHLETVVSWVEGGARTLLEARFGEATAEVQRVLAASRQTSLSL